MSPERQSSGPPAAEWKSYGRLSAFVRPYVGGLVVVMAISLVATALGLIQPYLTKLLVDDALIQKDMNALIEIAGLMFLVTVLGFVFNIAASYRYVKLSAAMLFDMRVALFRHLQSLSPRFYARFRLGDLMSRLNGDVGEVQRVTADSLLAVVSNIVFFIGCVGIMLWLNWRLFVVSVILVPGCVLSFLYYQKKLTTLTREWRERSADVGSLFVDTILGMRVVVSLRAGPHEVQRFRERNDASIATMLKMQVASYMTAALPSTILTAATAAVFLYGGWMIIAGEMTIGTIVAFMAYHMRLLSPIQTLLGMASGLASARVSVARIFELFDTPPDVREATEPVPLRDDWDSLRFEHVALRYDRDPVLRDVDFVIPRGKFCVIVGPSGAGKSTIADLLVRYIDPDQGRVLIGSQDTRSLALNELRREILLLDQTPYLFNDSIASNIAFSFPSAGRADIEAAARAAGLDELLKRLPNGLETRVGERGYALSVGERQRVALARALLRRPNVIVLDEPTSALDAETEKLVVKGLREALPTATFIVITHRPALSDLADVLIELRDGSAQVSGL